jgi:hypothetical protein
MGIGHNCNCLEQMEEHWFFIILYIMGSAYAYIIFTLILLDVLKQIVSCILRIFRIINHKNQQGHVQWIIMDILATGRSICVTPYLFALKAMLKLQHNTDIADAQEMFRIKQHCSVNATALGPVTRKPKSPTHMLLYLMSCIFSTWPHLLKNK